MLELTVLLNCIATEWALGLEGIMKRLKSKLTVLSLTSILFFCSVGKAVGVNHDGTCSGELVREAAEMAAGYTRSRTLAEARAFLEPFQRKYAGVICVSPEDRILEVDSFCDPMAQRLAELETRLRNSGVVNPDVFDIYGALKD